uniref:Uncharacterized protein n=1 Tax=Timema shepardi TaxID=629360 RepID=A0A7R9B698_TIMSH|nr:unnamed protein product [Timema shepardi]
MAEPTVSKGYEKIFKPVFDKNIWKQAKPKLEDLKEGRVRKSALPPQNGRLEEESMTNSQTPVAHLFVVLSLWVVVAGPTSYLFFMSDYLLGQFYPSSFIDDEDSYDVVPNSQFVISRTAFKDNSSYYTIDKKRVQFKEVAKLLRSHGIDLDHNRFLILQGEVEQIAMMKPKGATEHETGMLEFLEDIIGTSRFKLMLMRLDTELSWLRSGKQHGRM